VSRGGGDIVGGRNWKSWKET